MGLQQFERRLERLVEGAFAKAFKSELRPVELGRRIARVMDQERTVGVRGELISPNRFTVALAGVDHERFESFAEELARQLGDAVREHARDERYIFLGSVEVELVADEGLTTGQFIVASEVRASAGGAVGSLVLPDGRRVAMAGDPVVIGRLPECEVSIDDVNASRRHAQVKRQGNEFVVSDLGSTNGTRVNGAVIRERVLHDGDEIVIGGSKIRFEAS